MIPYDTKLPVVYLKPGEMYFTDRPTVVSTVLGSCVSITMFNGDLKIGAICHGLLPTCNKEKRNICNNKCTDLYKYMDCAFRHMVHRFESYDLNRDEIEVKLFGGAGILTPQENEHGRMSIGFQNLRTTMGMIKKEGLKIRASDTGGSSGRKLFFLTHTGDVFLKHLKKTEARGW